MRRSDPRAKRIGNLHIDNLCRTADTIGMTPGENSVIVPELSRLERANLRVAWVNELDSARRLARPESLALVGESPWPGSAC
jgi:hypothetical protein